MPAVQKTKLAKDVLPRDLLEYFGRIYRITKVTVHDGVYGGGYVELELNSEHDTVTNLTTQVAWDAKLDVRTRWSV